MQQVTKYIVNELGTDQTSILSDKDQNLVKTVSVGSLPFYPNKDRVDLSFYDLNNVLIETIKDIKSYKVHGILQKDRINQIDVYPVEDTLAHGYLGDVKLTYSFFSNLFTQNVPVQTGVGFFVSEISTDRTEIRTTCLGLTDSAIKETVSFLHNRLNKQPLFSEIYLEFFDENTLCVGTNIMTEVVDGKMYVTFKIYNPLPESISEKSRFNVLSKVGDPVSFEVLREVEVLEEPVKFLRRPNFNIDVEKHDTCTTGYLNYDQLFSFPVSGSYTSLRDLADGQDVRVSVDYTDFSNFIHFSSAEERLENFRYKMELIEGYEETLKRLPTGSVEIQKVENLISGIISNFDHYERHLYFESGSEFWPKQNNVRPYTNVPVSDLDPEWWSSIIESARNYDETNPDILIEAIPFTIREDSRNEPFVVFVHMIGQHFDNEWIYAKAFTDKYRADNRLDFGISRDLVKDAIRDLGLELCESNQNLKDAFEACKEDGSYVTGSEVSVKTFNRISSGTEYQPMSQDTYRKEVYKRIYHNLPLLLKSKGTERGLRALINCFGIPDDTLTITVRGGVKVDSPTGYFGPMDGTKKSLDRVRTDCTGSLIGDPEEEEPTLHREVSVTDNRRTYSDDTHQVVLGFNLNEQPDQYFKSRLSTDGFDYDDVVGDLRNHGENYNKAFDLLRNNLLQEYEGSFRSPVAILRLVRYFDSILFRSVKEFLPARTNVSVGAVVEDSILHRNRYKGVTISSVGHTGYTEASGNVMVSHSPSDTQIVLLSGSISRVEMTGSDGGSALGCVPLSVNVETDFNTNGVTVNRTGSVPVGMNHWSTGLVTGSKPSFDDAPAYNGEYSGSQLQVSDAEVLDNPYRRGGSNTMMYEVEVRTLNYPAPLICDAVLNVRNAAYVHKYYIQTGSFINSLFSKTINENIPFEIRVPKTGTTLSAESKSIDLTVKGSIPRADRWFIGWSSGSVAGETDYFSYGFLQDSKNPSLRSERVFYNSDTNLLEDTHTVLYSDKISNRERLRVQVDNLFDCPGYLDTGTGYGYLGYGYYGEGGLVISYCIQSRYKQEDEAVWSTINSFTVRVDFEDGSSEYFTIDPYTMDPKYSEFRGCWGILVLSDVNIENKRILKFGVVSVSPKTTVSELQTHAFVYPGNIFFDADWYFGYGSSEEPGNWNYDNRKVSGYGWRLEWKDTSFNWKWL